MKNLIVTGVILTVLIADLAVMVMKQPRIKPIWITLWHVPFWIAALYIGWTIELPHFCCCCCR